MAVFHPFFWLSSIPLYISSAILNDETCDTPCADQFFLTICLCYIHCQKALNHRRGCQEDTPTSGKMPGNTKHVICWHSILFPYQSLVHSFPVFPQLVCSMMVVNLIYPHWLVQYGSNKYLRTKE